MLVARWDAELGTAPPDDVSPALPSAQTVRTSLRSRAVAHQSSSDDAGSRFAAAEPGTRPETRFLLFLATRIEVLIVESTVADADVGSVAALDAQTVDHWKETMRQSARTDGVEHLVCLSCCCQFECSLISGQSRGQSFRLS